MDTTNLQDDNQIAMRIVELCRDSDEGVPHDILSRSIQATEQKAIEILNQLFRGGHITVKTNADGVPIYSYQDPDRIRRFQGLDRDHMDIYELIKQADTNGLSKNDIKNKSGKNPTVLNTVLKNLQKRNIIKSEKSINQKNRNVWILSELEPSVAVRGNIFYKKGEFNQEFVDAIYDKIYQYIVSMSEKQDCVTKREISHFLRSTDFASADLKDEDISRIIDVLVFDDKIEEIHGQKYKACDWNEAIIPSVLTQTPCGTCPVFMECREGSIISPEKCIYFLQW